MAPIRAPTAACFYEVTRRRLNRSIALEIIGRIQEIGSTAVSYESFSKALSISRDTARKYLDCLGDAFLLVTYSSFDTSRNRVAPRKDRKFLWVDPALGDLGPWLRQAEAQNRAVRMEIVAGTELLQRHEARLWEGLSSPRNVFTWRSSSGNEIDFLVVDKSQKFRHPFEVKDQNSISDWDFQVMERAFGSGTLLTRDTTKTRPKSAAIPMHAWLLA